VDHLEILSYQTGSGKFKMAADKQQVCYISACGLDRNVMLTAYSTILGYSKPMDSLSIPSNKRDKIEGCYTSSNIIAPAVH
jgi:hypothetical protein